MNVDLSDDEPLVLFELLHDYGENDEPIQDCVHIQKRTAGEHRPAAVGGCLIMSRPC
jgi:hypothetical protein